MVTTISEMQNMLPVCYHPMTVVLVDDDESLLQQMSDLLADHFPCKTFSNPLKALDFLNNQYKELSFAARCYGTVPEPDRNVRATEIDFRKFSLEVYRPQRFEQITAVIIDYAMPKMNGLEFSNQLKNKRQLKPILLTGEASVSTALDAFNNREIYQYIRKDENPATIKNTLVEWITSIQRKYFTSLSLPAFTCLLEDEERPFRTLADPAYIDLVQKIMQTNHIIEYYMTEPLGSLIMFDKNAAPSWLAICDEEEINDLVYRAKLEGAPTNIIEDLQSHKKIPYFSKDAELGSSPRTWESYMHPADLLKGEKDYWYAHITDPNAYKLENKIVSFNNYINSL